MTFVSLFAGIGGFDLGLERAGWTCVGQVEVDPYGRSILERHWPDVRRRGDIRLVDDEWAQATWRDVDAIVGGFPCQNISSANVKTRDGLSGKQSGLWSQFCRLIAACRPRWVIAENSPRWRSWVPQVRADLARHGYASVPVEVSAAQMGADHQRPRVWVVAHADGDGECCRALDAEMARLATVYGAVRPWADPPQALGVAHGIPRRLDRLGCLGNAVVPQIPELIGRVINDVEAAALTVAEGEE